MELLKYKLYICFEMILVNFLYKPMDDIKLFCQFSKKLKNLNDAYVYINKAIENNNFGSVTYYSFYKEVSELFTKIQNISLKEVKKFQLY